MIIMQQTTYAEANHQPSSALAMPVQAPPIDRSGTAAAHAANAAPGVEANSIVPTLPALARFLDIDIDTPWGHGGIHI
ncbi:hypothetical protein ACFWJU_30710 [Streptomyces mutabilis]|uniref:hypothetical protein n=1 Tax=Streptomyces mutabilis TaxID=67332 RepID=UPI003655BB21